MDSHQIKQLETTLWEAATGLRSSSGLKSNEYTTPILGIVFLRFADSVYGKALPEIEKTFAEMQASRSITAKRSFADTAIEICGFYLPDVARYDYLLKEAYKPTAANQAIAEAMREIERHNEGLKDSLPINEYNKIPFDVVEDLIKKFSEIPMDAGGDIFGHIYEFFLDAFAMAEGQSGGEFYTPPPIVRLFAEVLEPKGGKMLDPACGSGGMFVQNANYIKKHHPEKLSDFMVYGIEKNNETAKLARMNATIHGIRYSVMNDNTFQVPVDIFGIGTDLKESFEYVCANPPFNVKEVKADTVQDKEHFNRYGLPKNKAPKATKKGEKKAEDVIPNANYLWISLFATALKPKGRAGLVMANSASDAGGSEFEIRKTLIEQGIISAMLTLSSNMFNTVTLPATLWFFEKPSIETPPKEGLLFIDARNIFTQITRKQRIFTAEQIQNIATIFRLYRGETYRFYELINTYQQQADAFLPALEVVQKEVDKLKADEAFYQKQLVETKKEAENDHESVAKMKIEVVEKLIKSNLFALEKKVAELKKIEKQQKYYLDHIEWLTSRFPEGKYRDVVGLCKVASLEEIKEQNYSLNPGRYVGVVIEQDGLTYEEFEAEMRGYHTQLEALNAQSQENEKHIQENLASLFRK